MKIFYFENTHRDESNDILYDIIYLCILVEKYGQSKLGQNCIFLIGSSIAGRREYLIWLKVAKSCRAYLILTLFMSRKILLPSLNT